MLFSMGITCLEPNNKRWYRKKFNSLHSDINIIVTSWKKEDTDDLCDVSKPVSTVYVATGYTVVPFLRAPHYIKTQMQCMSFFMSVYLQRESVHWWYWNGVCDIIYREELSSHYLQIILQSSMLLQLIEYWVIDFHLFHYSHMLYVVRLL